MLVDQLKLVLVVKTVQKNLNLLVLLSVHLFVIDLEPLLVE
jgi:hypothetical protein